MLKMQSRVNLYLKKKEAMLLKEITLLSLKYKLSIMVEASCLFQKLDIYIYFYPKLILNQSQLQITTMFKKD
jgi:hypothetical protein